MNNLGNNIGRHWKKHTGNNTGTHTGKHSGKPQEKRGEHTHERHRRSAWRDTGNHMNKFRKKHWNTQEKVRKNTGK